MQFTIHTGLKQTLFELHHGRKPRTESTNLVKDSKSFLSDWTELSVSAEKKTKISIYGSRNEEEDITNYLVMAKQNSVNDCPFKFVAKNYNRKSSEGNF